MGVGVTTQTFTLNLLLKIPVCVVLDKIINNLTKVLQKFK